jgi:hypothetical protein
MHGFKSPVTLSTGQESRGQSGCFGEFNIFCFCWECVICVCVAPINLKEQIDCWCWIWQRSWGIAYCSIVKWLGQRKLVIQVWRKYQVVKAIELCRCCLVDIWNVCVAGSNNVKTEYVESYSTVFIGMGVYFILSWILQHVNIWSTIILSDSVFGFISSWLLISIAVSLLPCCFSFAWDVLFKYKYFHSLGVRKDSCWAIIGE